MKAIVSKLRDSAAAAFSGLALMTAASALPSAAHAEDGQNYASASSTSVDIETVRARNAVLKNAREHARLNPGEIGISVLKGPDTGDMTGDYIAEAFERGFANGFEEGQFKRPSLGFDGDNGQKITEVDFSYAVLDENTGNIRVITRGPYNVGDAMDIMREVAIASEAEVFLNDIGYDGPN